MTDPSVNYLEMLSDTELIELWHKRVNRLKNSMKQEEIFGPPDWMEESIDRVEKEMARRNMPIPGETTWKS